MPARSDEEHLALIADVHGMRSYHVDEQEQAGCSVCFLLRQLEHERRNFATAYQEQERNHRDEVELASHLGLESAVTHMADQQGHLEDRLHNVGVLRGAWRRTAETLKDRLKASEDARAVLVDALNRYCWHDAHDSRYCNACNGNVIGGHLPGCKLEPLLRGGTADALRELVKRERLYGARMLKKRYMAAFRASTQKELSLEVLMDDAIRDMEAEL